jgi:hypothetical protein
MRLKSSIASMLLLMSVDDGAFAGGPVIDRFEAVRDCVFPDPRRSILSYQASGGVLRTRVEALHRGGRVRAFHSQSAGRTPIPRIGALGVQDPGAAEDVEAYRLVVTGEGGAEVTRRLDFRYRRAVFELLPPALHSRAGGLARYQVPARLAYVESVTCAFRVDLWLLTTRRAGSADIFRRSGDPLVRCDIMWPSAREAQAGGTIEWTARVTDTCTQGRITSSARVNAIP